MIDPYIQILYNQNVYYRKWLMKFNIFTQFKHLKEYYLIKKSGLFDINHYLESYPDVKEAKLDPIMHYIKKGWQEGKNPSPEFDTRFYLREHMDVRHSRINPLVHYIQFGIEEDRPTNPQMKILWQYNLIKKSGLFNESYYLESYANVKESNIDPIMHYVKTGWQQGMNPSPEFDTRFYLRDNYDVRQLKFNPLIHYIRFGREEGRPTNSQMKNLKEYNLIKKSGLFDESFYLETYPEVIKAKIDPIMHYIRTGWREEKKPSPDFDTRYYLREYKDVRYLKINPFLHYIQSGKEEDRPTNRSLSPEPDNYNDWIDQYDTLTPQDISQINDHLKTFKYRPLISILIPVYNTPEQFLREALDSVIAQCYSNWECCIADDASTQPHVREILETYAEKDPRFKVTYREKNGHISAASNTALSMASGEYIAFLDHDDILREHALYFVVNEINSFPDTELVYSDEDLVDDEFSYARYEPYFKPDWNPDLFYGQNLISHFSVYSADKVRQVGGFREGYEGAQDWDLAMRISEIIPASSIRHIPFILYHWRATVGSTALSSIYKDYAKNAQYLTINSHFTRMRRSVELTFTEDEHWKLRHIIPDPKPLVSIIIPTRNQVQLLQTCIDCVQSKTQYPNYEILIVNNQSDEIETLNYLDQVGENELVTILDYDFPFNYSAINNFAARQARGSVLVFLNNDIEVISPDWLAEMVGHAIRSEIGAVGAMLYYPNDTIQHAGVILGMRGIAGHGYHGVPRGIIGQRGRARLTQNLSAVTGACMVVEKAKFFEIDGFNEKQLAVAYNDIDLCLRLVKAGYRNVWTPHAELYHLESFSRKYEDTQEKQDRFKSEADYLVNTWPEVIANDPAYNLNLSLMLPDFSLGFPPRVIKPWAQESPEK